MTGLITLADAGQDYIKFDVWGLWILAVAPSGKEGWGDTKILNSEVDIGGHFELELHNEYNCTLEHLITKIEPAPHITTKDWLLLNMSSGARLYANNTTLREHLAYSVTCNTIPLYFDEYNPASISAAQALLATDNFPPTLFDVIDGAQLVSEPSPQGENVIATIRDGLISIYGNRIIDEGIIGHEAAHTWAMWKWGDYDPPADGHYITAINSGEPPVTVYAGVSVSEDFAEAVRLYVRDPVNMRDLAPLRYDVVHRLMTDPGYYG